VSDTSSAPIDTSSSTRSISLVRTIYRGFPSDFTEPDGVDQNNQGLLNAENFVVEVRQCQIILKKIYQFVMIKMKCNNADIYIIVLYDLVITVYTVQMFLISEHVTFDIVCVEFMVKHATL